MTDDTHTDSEAKSKSDVYWERNLLALAFIHQFRGTPYDYGWWPDQDAVNGEEWAVIWANTGEGQVGWHIPTDMLPEWLPKRDPNYDGYTTDEKNQRVAKLARVSEVLE